MDGGPQGVGVECRYNALRYEPHSSIGPGWSSLSHVLLCTHSRSFLEDTSPQPAKATCLSFTSHISISQDNKQPEMVVPSRST